MIIHPPSSCIGEKNGDCKANTKGKTAHRIMYRGEKKKWIFKKPSCYGSPIRIVQELVQAFNARKKINVCASRYVPSLLQ